MTKMLIQSAARRGTERLSSTACEPNVAPENVLIVGIPRSEQAWLARALGLHSCPQYWVSSMEEAIRLSHKIPVRVVICNAELDAGSWRSLWRRLRAADDPPAFIVSSRSAHNRLWAEVLDVDGFDTVLRPFDSARILRVIQTACGAV